MNSNLNLFKTNQEIKNILANSSLSIGESYFLIKNIYLELEQLFEQQIYQEYQNIKEKHEEEDTNE